MGNYVKNNLVNGEDVVFETKYHWVIFISLKSLLSLGIIPLVAYLTDEFAITNKRVIIKTGLIARKTFEMNLSKIESVNVDQGIMGRILGYGDVLIVGSGGTREIFPTISNPIQFRKKFQEMTL